MEKTEVVPLLGNALKKIFVGTFKKGQQQYDVKLKRGNYRGFCN
jgi:hypothetical protein